MRMSVEFQINQFGKVFFCYANHIWVRESVKLQAENPFILIEFVLAEIKRKEDEK